MSNIDNLFARDGFFWWMGVVEDRKDPLKLGRCRIRILGYHNENKNLITTYDLPWAMPMQPITSAANSGKGTTPLGPLEGTWVVGFFADGKECQQPIIMGTIGGIPEGTDACNTQSKNSKDSQNAATDVFGNIIYDASGNSQTVQPEDADKTLTVSNSITSSLPPLSQAQLQLLMDDIASRESSSISGGAQNYSTVNAQGYVGKYQFGIGALVDAGYIKANVGPNPQYTQADLNDPRVWTGKSDVNNLQDFLGNKNNTQENAMFENLESNYKTLIAKGAIDPATSEPTQVAGYLAAAHLAGATGASKLRYGSDPADALGTRASVYYSLGAQSLGGSGDRPVAVSQRNANKPTAALNTALNLIKTAAGALNNPKLGQPDGYADPNGVYPRCSYTARADTNKLATNNDDLKTTPQPEKSASRIDKVETANDASGTWAEPPSAFAAKYPYNHVKETESGHVVEFDDTPNAERIHIYHRTGTYVEIDREGSVSYKVMGENYNIYTRNNRVYTQGNMDVTVDGAKTLLVKNTLDVQVAGKTTINIGDDCDINVAKDLRIKAQNIYMEAQQDINITAGNYENHKVAGDLNFRVTGDEQHRVTGSIDMDAQDINLNSGTANPYTATLTSLDDGILSNLAEQGFAATGLNPLPIDIASPGNSFGKGISGLLGGFSGGGLGLLGNALSNPAIANAVSGFSMAGNLFGSGALQGVLGNLGGGGIGSILKIAGVDGLNKVLDSAGIGSISDIVNNAIAKSGIGGFASEIESALSALGGSGNISNVLTNAGLGDLNKILGDAGLGSLESLVSEAGFDLDVLKNKTLDLTQNSIIDALKNSTLISSVDLIAGENLIIDFYKNGVANINTTLPQLIQTIATDSSEFINWTDYPASAQLSSYFTLGDLTTRVQDTNAQFELQDQGDFTRYDIISNMKALSVNVLDPLYEKYPNMIISDGFKLRSSDLLVIDENNAHSDLLNEIITNASPEALDLVNQQINSFTPYHQGQAVNLHFIGVTAAEYYSIAEWIKDNIAYDQLRLEYTTLGSKEPWISVSFNQLGNRDIDYYDKIVTAVNGQVVANYLADLTS